MKRHICTKEKPMPKNAEGRWTHDDVEILDSSSDYYESCRCRSCGHEWKYELPE